MPLIHIHMFAGRTPEQKARLLHAVAMATHEAVEVPLEAVRVWISEFGEHEFVSGARLHAQPTDENQEDRTQPGTGAQK